MDHLDVLESKSIYIIREAFNRIDKLAMLWSIGKDSNVMLWCARKAFFGHIPFPLLNIDTEKKFAEVYEFRDRITKEWNLDVRIGGCPPVEEMDQSLPPAARSAARKTAGLKRLIAEGSYTGLIAGIRRDEEGTRAKERVFSPRSETNTWNFRDQPPEFWDQFNTEFAPGTHVRVHPLLHWTEMDIWLYTRRENIPLVPLYFAKDGKRYRSLGDQDITFPVDSNADTIDAIIEELKYSKVAERAGRAMDHEAEDSFERLRADGYL
ncbi:sulfate adenylyltransferase subunit CysD [Defluviicoccus vanus]|uniref:Sulfate adenylyltransferase subunit 2 n=1 Tax=Defluviicoccus vanus TaxID=111831 RepID=A0A7H1MYP5_9PROT|nr:sulfate adenylyltransferase subunit CysD [Defluviicoccus vanus]QNT68581.1 sulfate adenylyltransferase subunit 2 [Defluviicoccus vanus]